jgi:hypothetical protein
VLYNCCFGGFSFNRKFVEALFQRFPPSSPEGEKLFPESKSIRDLGTYELQPFFGDYHFLIESESDRYEGYEPCYIKDLKTNKIYYLTEHMTKHRANPDIIKFLFERVDMMSEDEFNKELKIKEIISKDNTKKFSINNWKESEQLVSHMLTLGISGRCANLHIEQVKPELTWRISEYDGSEAVHVKFDYYTLISELVHELQINKINPSSNCSEMMSKIIKGEMTIQDLKDFERS